MKTSHASKMMTTQPAFKLRKPMVPVPPVLPSEPPKPSAKASGAARIRIDKEALLARPSRKLAQMRRQVLGLTAVYKPM